MCYVEKHLSLFLRTSFLIEDCLGNTRFQELMKNKKLGGKHMMIVQFLVKRVWTNQANSHPNFNSAPND